MLETNSTWKVSNLLINLNRESIFTNRCFLCVDYLCKEVYTEEKITKGVWNITFAALLGTYFQKFKFFNKHYTDKFCLVPTLKQGPIFQWHNITKKSKDGFRHFHFTNNVSSTNKVFSTTIKFLWKFNSSRLMIQLNSCRTFLFYFIFYNGLYNTRFFLIMQW